MSLILQGELTEKAKQELFESRYSGGYYDLMEECLLRTEGLAGLIVSATSLCSHKGVNDGIDPADICQAATLLENEAKDAKIILDNFYLEYHKANADD